jgi:APA family basic amino acid/polyamine antiporter
MLATGVLTVCAVFVLRRKMPELPRPYRVWGYPYTPLFYVLSSLAVLGVLVHDRNPSVAAVAGWFALALGFHWFVMRPRERAHPNSLADSAANENATGRA